MIKTISIALLIAGGMMTAALAADRNTVAVAGRYQGVLTCEGCVDSDYRIDLFDDGAYYLRVTQTDAPNRVQDDVGRWVRSTDGRLLTMRGREKLTRYFVPEADGALRVYEAGEGTLRRNDKLPLLEPAGSFTGLFRYMADAPTFEDCASGRTVPVEMAGAYPDLERSYLRVQRSPGEALMVRVSGSFKMLPPMEGDQLVSTLRVDSASGFLPAGACSPVPKTPRCRKRAGRWCNWELNGWKYPSQR